MPDSTVSTLGQRLYRIRLDRGDGLRKPEPMKAFAAYLRETFPDVKGLSESALSGWENDLTDPNRHQIWALAAADPKHRGPAWLAWGNVPVVGHVGSNGDTVEITDRAALERAEAADAVLRSTPAGAPAAPGPPTQPRHVAQGRVVPHSAFVRATTPTPAELQAERDAQARRRRPGSGGRGKR